MKRWLCLGAIAYLVGCGGRAEEPAPTGSGGAAAGSASPGAGAGTTSPALPSHDLGDCKPGFARAANPTRPCNWVTDSGVCFEDNDAACACICPSNADSVCWSGFYDGSGSATLVHCS